MPTAKKGSGNKTPSKTLHTFFAKPGNSSPAAPRLRPATSKLKVKSSPPPNREVIVIESDEEDAASTSAVPKKGKRKSSTFADAGSSDIEVLESRSGPSLKKHRCETGSSSQAEDLGENTGLLPSAFSSRPAAFPTNSNMPLRPTHITLPPRASGSALASARSSGSDSTSSPIKTPVFQPAEHVLNQSEDVIELDDEWGMGDDELADGDEEDTENMPAHRQLELCPDCGCKLKGLTALVRPACEGCNLSS